MHWCLSMKNLTLAIFITQLTISNSVYAADPVNTESIPGYNELSLCEKSLLTGSPTAGSFALITGGRALALGVLSGGTVFGFGVILESISASSLGSLNVLAGGGVGALGSVPSKGLIISAVGTGVVFGAIMVGASYVDYRTELSTIRSQMQFFRDVKNGTMGPQVELRIQEIQAALKKVSILEKIFGRDGLKYSAATYEEKNIALELQETGLEILNSNIKMPCDNSFILSKMIDDSVMKRLIEKYNPQLKVDIK